MIPKKLTLKNFMSYGEEPVTLDFEGMNVVCLSGDNGNGKSALLDAMTWALWGKTRASGVGAVQEDSLIRLGATDMEVRFEFQLNHDRYRVVRKRKKGKGDWQLAQQNEAGDFISLSGGSQRETGAQIIKLLRMQHETFLNSAYLQQGRADEFTRQRPNDRKRILAEILDLNRYDRLEAMAKEKSAENKSQADEISAEIAHLLREVDRKSEYEQNLADAVTDREALAQKVQEQEQGLKEKQEHLETLKAAQQAAENVGAELARMERELAGREQERRTVLAERKSIEGVQAQREAILKDYEGLQRARTRREELDPKVVEFEQVSKEIAVAVGVLDIERTRLIGELTGARKTLVYQQKQEQETRQLTLQIAALIMETAVFPSLTEALTSLKDEAEKVSSEFADKKQQREALLVSLKEQGETIAELERPLSQCRLCNSDLSGDRKERVLKRQREVLGELETRRDELTQAGRDLKLKRDSVRLQLETTQSRWNSLSAKRAQLETLQLRHNDLCQEEHDVAGAEKAVATLGKRIEGEDFSQAERIRLKSLESRRQGLTLVKAEYGTVSETVQRLKGAEARYQDLKTVDSRFVAVSKEAERLSALIVEGNKERDETLTKQDGFRKKAAGYPQATLDVQTANQNWRLSLEDLNVRVRDVERFTDTLARLEASRAEAATKEKTLKQCVEARQCYDALKMAFGKKGIQTQIIENAALPELEDEANRLLARLSDNNMTVHLETTRAAASGSNEIETLDIIITDDAGTRPYELFSGGEGFRVNFALRIALSRLLARRSGAKLQTLILDEGFGSQDGKGREKLVEVIEAIKEDFDLILVITHFDELKDSFPQRIEVIKDAKGSRIQLL